MEPEQVLSRLFGKYCPEGMVLYAAGAPGEDLFVVRSGAVRLLPARGGAGNSAETCGPGQVFGEEAFFGRVPRASRAEVVRDAQLLRVSDRTLDAVARYGPDVARTVAERLLELAGTAARRLEAWMLWRQALRAQAHLAGAGRTTAEELAERAGLPLGGARAVLEALCERGALVQDAAGYRITEAAALESAVRALSEAAA